MNSQQSRDQKVQNNTYSKQSPKNEPTTQTSGPSDPITIKKEQQAETADKQKGAGNYTAAQGAHANPSQNLKTNSKAKSKEKLEYPDSFTGTEKSNNAGDADRRDPKTDLL